MLLLNYIGGATNRGVQQVREEASRGGTVRLQGLSCTGVHTYRVEPACPLRSPAALHVAPPTLKVALTTLQMAL
jgi:hypothetical protein